MIVQNKKKTIKFNERNGNVPLAQKLDRLTEVFQFYFVIVAKTGREKVEERGKDGKGGEKAGKGGKKVEKGERKRNLKGKNESYRIKLGLVSECYEIWMQKYT